MGYANAFKNDIVVTLLSENATLTVQQAVDYAERIARAELREDYETMYKLIQEGLYGERGLHAA